MANQVRGVLYLQRDRFLLSLDSRADILTFLFPPASVSNLDILDADALKQSLSEFIKQNKVMMTNLVIVLSNAVIFEQDFKTAEETLIQEFLDNVPYETISIKKIPIAGGTKVLIGNATFYTLLAEVFKQNGAALSYVIPEKALGAPIASFNASTARLILTQFEALSQYKFVIDETTEDKTDFKPPERKKIIVHKKNYTLLYTIPVFAILILVLLFMILQPIIFKDKSTTAAQASALPTGVPVSAPTDVPTSPLPTAAPAVLKKATTAQIIFDPTSAAKVDQLKTSLAALGITNIQTSATPTDISVPIVTTLTTIDPTQTSSIQDAVKKIFPAITSQSSSTQSVDLIITIGKS